MKNITLLTLLVFSTAQLFASDPVPINPVNWVYSAPDKSVTFTAEFLPDAFPIMVTLDVETQTGDSVSQLIKWLNSNSDIMKISGLNSQMNYSAKMKFENVDGFIYVDQDFNTFISAVSSIDATKPIVLLSNGMLKITADYPVNVQVTNLIGQTIEKRDLNTDITIDMMWLAHQTYYLVTITDKNNKVILTTRKFLN